VYKAEAHIFGEGCLELKVGCTFVIPNPDDPRSETIKILDEDRIKTEMICI
jgi:hypothetical protein